MRALWVGSFVLASAVQFGPGWRVYRAGWAAGRHRSPDMNTLVLPYSIGMPSAVQAVASSGRDIKIYADDLDAVNVQMLRDGAIEMVSSVDPRLAMYQCIDQVVRGLNDGGYVEPARLPYLAHLYTKDGLPDTGVGAFAQFFDYEAVYRDLWKKP